MANDINLVVLTGRTTKEPEMYSSNKSERMAIANFCMAVDTSSGKGEKTATFIDCVAFGKVAEIIEKYVAKGDRILVKGNMRKDSYEKDGKKYYNTKVCVNEVIFLENRNRSNTTTASGGFMNIPEGMEDELPFN